MAQIRDAEHHLARLRQADLAFYVALVDANHTLRYLLDVVRSLLQVRANRATHSADEARDRCR